MLLEDALLRENNNADLLRLVAALAVIWGHAYALAPSPEASEPIGALLGFDYSGSLAVKFFFFLSGMLVTISWMRQESPAAFATARIFRIFPSLIVSSALCLLVLGPVLTTLPISEYFSNTWMFKHIIRYPYLDYEMPGVFQANAYHAGNGSIWTIRHEVTMYVVLLGLAMCGLFRSRHLASAVYSAMLLWFLIRPDSISVFGLMNNNDAGRLPSFFAFGVLLALWKDVVRIDGRLVAGVIVLAWSLKDGPAFQYAFYLAFLLAPIWLMTTSVVRAIKLPGDFSYGVYVYGWPVQQVAASFFPSGGPYLNQAISMSVGISLAAASWYFVEKPAISLGRRVTGVFSLGWLASLQKSSQSHLTGSMLPRRQVPVAEYEVSPDLSR